MRMDEMNKMFEDRGFTVERKYENHGYRFTISKDGNYCSEHFVYPCGVSSNNASRIQRSFVRDMIGRFHDEFKKFKVGDRVKVVNTDFEFKKKYVGNFYKIKDIEPSSADLYDRGPRYIMDSAMVDYIFYESELELAKPDDSMIAFADAYNIVSKEEEFLKYCELDVKMTEEMWTKMNPFRQTNIKIKNVIFNDPATIVFWSDGTKTVVKRQDDDIFDPEKGLAMAISKKALGNKGNYCNELKRWLPEEESEVQEFNVIGNVESVTKVSDGISFECTLSEEASKDLTEKFKKLTIPKLDIKPLEPAKKFMFSTKGMKDSLERLKKEKEDESKN